MSEETKKPVIPNIGISDIQIGDVVKINHRRYVASKLNRTQVQALEYLLDDTTPLDVLNELNLLLRLVSEHHGNTQLWELSSIQHLTSALLDLMAGQQAPKD